MSFSPITNSLSSSTDPHTSEPLPLSNHHILHFVWCLGGSLLIFGLLYRLRLFYNLYYATPSYRAFQPQQHSFLSLWQHVWYEWAWAVQVAAVAWVCWFVGRTVMRWIPRLRFFVVGLGWSGLHVALLGISFLYGAHLRALFDVQSGLTYDLWAEGRDAFGPQDLLRFMSFVDILFLFLPMGLFWFFWVYTKHRELWRNRILIVLSVILLLLLAIPAPTSSHALDQAVKSTPIQFLISDYLRVRRLQNRPSALEDSPTSPHPRSRSSSQSTETRSTPIPPLPTPRTTVSLRSVQTAQPLPDPQTAQSPSHPVIPQLPERWGEGRLPEETIRLIGDSFLRAGHGNKHIPRHNPTAWQKHALFPNLVGRPIHRSTPTLHRSTPTPHRSTPLPSGSKRPWNVLFYMLESVGTRYIFDQSRGHRMPMAFLQQIAQRGWYFTNHYSSANSSPRAIFSLLTGLYPLPELDMFEMRSQICSPTIYDFVRDRYDAFFMTPGSFHWYFPQHLFLNHGPPHLYDARNFKRFKKYGSFPNEIDVTTEFIRRIRQAKEPFFASYLSFIPHGPYDDYGPKYRILPNVKRDLHRYYNNLYVLDLQIKRVMQALHESGLLERTIVVFVGDHGQAFGQHRRNWGHSRQSYNENYHAPLIFYQPQLFEPRQFSHRTSHVDIVPTLLDVMQIPYQPLLFQGESLFQRQLLRKQIFLFGNESTLSLIDQNDIKMQYLLTRRQCWVYDLKQDPDEKNRQNCQAFQEQRKALREYLQLQPKLRRNYETSCRTKMPFFGLQHRSLFSGNRQGLANTKKNK